LISTAEVNADEGAISLDSASLKEIRLLRRAFDGLAQAQSVSAVPYLQTLVAYLPSITPSVARYLVTDSLKALPEADEAATDICLRTSLSEWQEVWLLYVLRTNAVIKRASDESDLKSWVRDRTLVSSPLARAMAWLCLAAAGEVTVSGVLEAMDNSPTSVHTVYLEAIVELKSRGLSESDAKRVRTVSLDGAAAKALLE